MKSIPLAQNAKLERVFNYYVTQNKIDDVYPFNTWFKKGNIYNRRDEMRTNEDIPDFNLGYSCNALFLLDKVPHLMTKLMEMKT